MGVCVCVCVTVIVTGQFSGVFFFFNIIVEKILLQNWNFIQLIAI